MKPLLYLLQLTQYLISALFDQLCLFSHNCTDLFFSFVSFDWLTNLHKFDYLLLYDELRLILDIIERFLPTQRCQILYHFRINRFVNVLQRLFQFFCHHLTLIRRVSFIESIELIIRYITFCRLVDRIIWNRQLLVIIFI